MELGFFTHSRLGHGNTFFSVVGDTNDKCVCSPSTIFPLSIVFSACFALFPGVREGLTHWEEHLKPIML